VAKDWTLPLHGKDDGHLLSCICQNRAKLLPGADATTVHSHYLIKEMPPHVSSLWDVEVANDQPFHPQANAKLVVIEKLFYEDLYGEAIIFL